MNGSVLTVPEMLVAIPLEVSPLLSLQCTNTVSLRLTTKSSGRSKLASILLFSRFFRVCTEICVDVSPQDDVKGRYHIYSQIDAFVRLVCLLIKHSGDAHNPGITEMIVRNR